MEVEAELRAAVVLRQEGDGEGKGPGRGGGEEDKYQDETS